MPTIAPRLIATLRPEEENHARLESIGAEIAAGRLVPYLGPGVLDCFDKPAIPTAPVALAMELHARAPVGAKLRGDLWRTAQFIEQRRHRKTLIAFMTDIFKVPAAPGPLHTWLARQQAPLIVDTWYDAALGNAFRAAGRQDFGEVQGVTRAQENRDIWTKAYSADGNETSADAAKSWATVLYKPHGSVLPAQNYLVADSDYVEALTEIDIQSPIPDVVQERRQNCGFVFIGCRFDDQMLRTYARQIMKRSKGPRYAVVDFEPTRMEERFLAEQGIEPVASGLAHAIGVITGI